MSDIKYVPPVLAFCLAITGYMLFTMGDTLAKFLQNGYHASQILFTANCVGLLIMCGLAVWTRGPRDAFKTKKWKLHLLRGVLITANTILVLYALTRLPLADFYGIVFLNPLWVALISCFILKEHIPPSRWVAIGVGFLGVLVIAGSHFKEMNLGVFAALIGSFIGANSALLARHIGGSEAPTNFGIAVHLVMVVTAAVWLPHHFVMPTWQDFGLMVAYGTMLSLAMIAISYVFSRSQSVSQIAPLLYTQMLWGVLLGWLVFGNTPTQNVLAGSLLVIGAGIYILKSLRRGRLMTR